MRALCLTLPEQPERTERCRQHLASVWSDLGVHFVTAINGHKTGLVSTHPYDHDHPGTNYVIGPATIGIFISHYIAWSIVDAGADEHVLILEDDVILVDNFHFRATEAIGHASKDFDLLFLGSCCTDGHPKTHIMGDVYEMKWPQCLHAYILAKKAARTLLTTYRDVFGPIDCVMRLDGYAGLKVYTVLPRLAEQLNTNLPT